MGTLSYLQTSAALAIVLGLIALATFIARKTGFGGVHVRRDERRLSIVEAMTLDPKRRVLLIKCDSTEHLVLLGPTSETLLSGSAPSHEIYQSSTTPALGAPKSPVKEPQLKPPQNAAEAAAARAAAFAARGAATLSQPVGEKPDTWTTRKTSSGKDGRREPIIGPVPREPK